MRISDWSSDVCSSDLDLTVVAASVASDGEAAALAQRLRDLGRPISGVVAAIRGNIERGRLIDQPEEFLRRRLDEDLLPHLFAARHLLPLLAEHGHGGYVLIGGPGRSEEHTSELQSLMRISYAVFC